MKNSRWFFTWLTVLIVAWTPAYAATTTKSSYGSNNQAITITLTSLANNAVRGSVAVDNTTNLFLDVAVMITFKTGTVSGTPVINIYVAGTADNGTTYSDGVSGTDATQTLTSPPNVILIGTCNTPANATTYKCGPYFVARGFNGSVPAKWVLLVENKTGAASDASVGSAFYQGYYVQTV